MGVSLERGDDDRYIHEIRVAEWFAHCWRERKENETIIEVSRRLLIEAALQVCETQKQASDLLCISTRVMCYYVKDGSMRPEFGG